MQWSGLTHILGSGMELNVRNQIDIMSGGVARWVSLKKVVDIFSENGDTSR